VKHVRKAARRNPPGPLTGLWRQYITDPSRIDVIRCKQNGKIVKAKIKRIEPPPKPGKPPKEWDFQGLCMDDFLFGTYCTTDEINNSGSYGTIQLFKQSHNEWAGFYVRLEITVDKRIIKKEEGLAEPKTTWVRQPK